MDSTTVSVVMINYNGLRDIQSCLASIKEQDYPSLEVLLVDNNSSDGSRELLASFVSNQEESPDRKYLLLLNEENVGFSSALNRGIRESTGEFVMSLNTDVVMDGEFISRLAEELVADPEAGSVSGRLLRFPVGGTGNLIDSVGHVTYRNRLTHNRGLDEHDSGQYLAKEVVFGTSGAAAMYRREMLEDVAVDGEYFDEDFFAFWEDVDLDWRANLRGWITLYVPGAVAYHRRGGAGYRKSLTVEYHNYKNQFLVMLKNDTGRGILRNLPAILFTHLLKTGALVVRCPRAITAWGEVFRLLPGMWKKRKVVQSRRVVPPLEMESRLNPFPYRAWIRRNLLSRAKMIRDSEAGLGE